jgi:hypothetical protein
MRIALIVAALLANASPVLAQSSMGDPRSNGPPIFPNSRPPFGNQQFPSGAAGSMRPGFSVICRVGNQACRMSSEGPIGTLCTCQTQSGIVAQGVVAGP